MSDSKHLLAGDQVESLTFPIIENQSPEEMAQCDNVWDMTQEQMRQLQLPTAEEIQQIREDAHQEGQKAGYEAGYEAGFSAGEKKALVEGKQRTDVAVSQLNAILNQLAQPLADQVDHTSNQLTQMLCAILKALLNRELLIDSSGVVAVVQEAMAAVEQGATRVQVRLNPRDIEHWQGDEPTMPALDEGVKLVADNDIAAGGCLVDTSACHVDGTVEARLAQVIEGLYETLSDHPENPIGGQTEDPSDGTAIGDFGASPQKDMP